MVLEQAAAKKSAATRIVEGCIGFGPPIRRQFGVDYESNTASILAPQTGSFRNHTMSEKSMVRQKPIVNPQQPVDAQFFVGPGPAGSGRFETGAKMCGR